MHLQVRPIMLEGSKTRNRTSAFCDADNTWPIVGIRTPKTQKYGQESKSHPGKSGISLGLGELPNIWVFPFIIFYKGRLKL